MTDSAIPESIQNPALFLRFSTKSEKIVILSSRDTPFMKSSRNSTAIRIRMTLFYEIDCLASPAMTKSARPELVEGLNGTARDRYSVPVSAKLNTNGQNSLCTKWFAVRRSPLYSWYSDPSNRY